MYIVSACLLGQNCKYNGGNNLNEEVVEVCKNHKYVTVCPESAAKTVCLHGPFDFSFIFDSSRLFSPLIISHPPGACKAAVRRFLRPAASFFPERN